MPVKKRSKRIAAPTLDTGLTLLPAPPEPTPPAYPPASQALFDATVQRLTAGSREDFLKMLASWTIAAPGSDPDDLTALRALAVKFPDRYMQGMTMVARMSGMMSDPSERHGGTTIIAFIQELRGLSDAEVYRRAREAALSIVQNGGGGPGVFPGGLLAGSSPAASTSEVRHVPRSPVILERDRLPQAPPEARDGAGSPGQSP